jgi:hypothetical protein
MHEMDDTRARREMYEKMLQRSERQRRKDEKKERQAGRNNMRGERDEL